MNIPVRKCSVVKLKVQNDLAGNFVEFSQLWDYTSELLAKNPGSTIKMSVERIIPISWAVVEAENAEVWSWFLELLNEDLELDNGFKFTIMSDQRKVRSFSFFYI